VRFQVRNTGTRAGKDVAQIFVSPVAGGWEAPRRLGAFAKVALAPGAARELDVRVDPRLLAVWDREHSAFRIAAGDYHVSLGHSARETDQTTTITLPERRIAAGGQ
jgi:beta-glucosidase